MSLSIARRVALLGITAACAAALGPASAGAVPPEIVDENGNSSGPAVPWPECDDCPEYEDTNEDNPPPVVSTDAGSTIPAGGSSCMWTVKGRLVVRDPTVDGLEDNDPLEDVEVKVSGRSSAGLWNEWGTDVTDAHGDFSVSEIQCNNRKVKIEAHLESTALRVTGSGSRSWYKLHETDGTVAPSTIDVKREPFGGETGDQSTSQARTDAQSWIVFQRSIDYAGSIGRPFLNKVVVHNPATLTVGISATDPILQDIHIDPNDTASLDTWLHELGHAWSYPHLSGEGCLTWDALLSGDTHEQQEDPCIATAEGFAEFFADKLEQELIAAGELRSAESSTSTLPMNRAQLDQTFGLDNLDEVARSDTGWEQVFRTLTSDDISRHLYGDSGGTPGSVGTYTGPTCTSPIGLGDLADALKAVGDSQSRFDISDDGDGHEVLEFLQRADDRLTSFRPEDIVPFWTSIDPAWNGDLSEPHEYYWCPPPFPIVP